MKKDKEKRGKISKINGLRGLKIASFRPPNTTLYAALLKTNIKGFQFGAISNFVYFHFTRKLCVCVELAEIA